MKLDDFLKQIVRLSLESESPELRTSATEFYVAILSRFKFSQDVVQPPDEFSKLFD
jgi:hypothetical protein